MLLFAPLLLLWLSPVVALDLQGAYQLALENDHVWQAAKATAQAGQEVLEQSKGQLLPNISLSGETDQVYLKTTRDPFAATREHYNSSNLTLALTQTLYRKSQFIQLTQAYTKIQGAEADLQSAKQNLAVRVASAYFEALYADDGLAALQVQQEATLGQLKAARRIFTAGEGTRTDIDEAQAALDLNQAQILQAQQHTTYTREQLIVLVGQGIKKLNPINLKRFKPSLTLHSLEDRLALAETKNPDLLSAQKKVEVAEQEVAKANSAHLPTLDLVAKYYDSKNESTQSLNTDYRASQIGVQFRVPLYVGGQIDSAVREAIARLEVARQQYEQTLQAVNLQIRKEYQNVTEGVTHLIALDQAAHSINQLVISTEHGIKAGTRTQIDLLKVFQQRANVNRDQASARYQFLLAKLKLQIIAGESIEDLIDDINFVLGEN